MTRIPASHVYEGLVEVGQISPDKNQRAALALLDQLAVKLGLKKHWSGGRKGLFRRHSWDRPERGLYIWGGVGRGKTFLMDLFVDSLPEGTAMRLHFHRFMNQVHERLTALPACHRCCGGQCEGDSVPCRMRQARHVGSSCGNRREKGF